MVWQRKLTWVALLMSCLLVLGGCDTKEQPSEARSDADGSPASPESVQPVSTPAQEAKLREAAKNGYIQIVMNLLKQGVDVNAPDDDKRTALMWAAFDGYTKVVKQLLRRGAEVDARDNVDRTALMYAASGPNIETVRLLLAHKAETNLVDGHEAWTALMFAAAEGHNDIVQALLKAGADRNLIDTDGDSAYDFAVQRGHRETARLVKPTTPDP